MNGTKRGARNGFVLYWWHPMSPFSEIFWEQPIDVQLYLFLLWFGWIPILAVCLWGFAEVWKFYRQGNYNATLRFVALAIDVPALTEQSPRSIENFFASLAGAASAFTWKETWFIGKFQPSFSFEIISTEGNTQFLIRLQTRYRDIIEAGIYAQYPDAEISEVEDYTAFAPSHYPNETHEMWGAEMVLKNPTYFPIRTYLDFEDKMAKEEKLKDPLGQTLEQIGKMRPGEHFWMQMVAQVTDNDWKKEGVDFINKLYGIETPPKASMLGSGVRALLSVPGVVIEDFTQVNIADLILGAQAKPKEQDQWKSFKLSPLQIEQAKAVLAKVSRVGYKVKIRFVYVAKKEAYNKGGRVVFIKGMLNQYSNHNRFGMYTPSIPRDDYFWQAWSYTKKQMKLMKAYKARSFGAGATPMILNVEEMATLWHFPALGVRAPFVKKSEARRAEPPIGLPIGGEEPLPEGPPRSFEISSQMEELRPTETGLMLPAEEAEAIVPHVLPPVSISVKEPLAAFVEDPGEEKEMGLDASDVIGPPSDVILPHPHGIPVSKDEAPPNLPV